MANMYRSVLAGGGAAVGDATAADVLTGKTFSGAVGSGVTGTMPNNGAVSGTATPSQPYTIPAGYHNGSGTVTASGSAISDMSITALTAVAGTQSITNKSGCLLMLQFGRHDTPFGVDQTISVSGLTLIKKITNTSYVPVAGSENEQIQNWLYSIDSDSASYTVASPHAQFIFE